MRWVVKKGDGYLDVKNGLTWVAARSDAYVYDNVEYARIDARCMEGRVVRLVPKRKRTSEAELAKILGIKHNPSSEMTLRVALNPGDILKIGEAQDCGGIVVTALGYSIGRVLEWSFSWS